MTDKVVGWELTEVVGMTIANVKPHIEVTVTEEMHQQWLMKTQELFDQLLPSQQKRLREKYGDGENDLLDFDALADMERCREYNEYHRTRHACEVGPEGKSECSRCGSIRGWRDEWDYEECPHPMPAWMYRAKWS